MNIETRKDQLVEKLASIKIPFENLFLYHADSLLSFRTKSVRIRAFYDLKTGFYDVNLDRVFKSLDINDLVFTKLIIKDQAPRFYLAISISHEDRLFEGSLEGNLFTFKKPYYRFIKLFLPFEYTLDDICI